MKNKSLITVMLAVAVSMSTSITAMATTTQQSSTPSQYSQLFTTIDSKTSVDMEHAAVPYIEDIYGKLTTGYMEVNLKDMSVHDYHSVDVTYELGKRHECFLYNNKTKDIIHIATVLDNKLKVNGQELPDNFSSIGVVADDENNWYIGAGTANVSTNITNFTHSYLLTVSKKTHKDGKKNIPDKIELKELQSDISFETGHYGNASDSYSGHFGKRMIFVESGELKYISKTSSLPGLFMGDVVTDDKYNSKVVSKECVDYKVTDDNKVYIKTLTGEVKVWNGNSFLKVS